MGSGKRKFDNAFTARLSCGGSVLQNVGNGILTYASTGLKNRKKFF